MASGEGHHKLAARRAQGALTDTAERQRIQAEQAEQQRGEMSNALGSKEQAFGEGQYAAGYDPRYDQYTDRIQVEEAGYRGVRGGVQQEATAKKYETDYNSLMSQALKAAQAGDFAQADALKAQADNLSTTMGLKKNINRPGVVTHYRDTSLDHLKALSSEQGKLVGRQIYDAAQLAQGPGNEVYDQTYLNLTKNALDEVEFNRSLQERAVTNEKTGMERKIRDQGAAGGAGRNIYKSINVEKGIAEQAANQMANVHDQAGAERAMIHQKASQFMEGYKRSMATNSVALAQAWVGGSAGVRDQYVQTQLAISNNLMNVQNQILKEAKAQVAADAADTGTNWASVALGAVVAVVGAVAAPFTGGTSLALVGTGASMAAGGLE